VDAATSELGTDIAAREFVRLAAGQTFDKKGHCNAHNHSRGTLMRKQNAAMRLEGVYRPSPICPHCGTPMRSTQPLPNCGARAMLQTFECALCGLSVTEAAEADINRDCWQNEKPRLGPGL
jgi:hypothetical protein